MTEKKAPAAKVDYKNVRIRNIPLSMQCWSYRKFSFFETLEKVEQLGINYLEAYPGQVLDSQNPDAKFGHNMNDDDIAKVKIALKNHNINLVSYGVVNFENSESMRRVFEFAKKMGIKTICTEPQYDDYSLIEKMVREYGINIAIHNHPTPSKYARPETVLEHVNGLDKRIGSCADTGHWMRSGVCPIEALKLMRGRILNVHLKDLKDFGTKETYDVPFGQGEGNIHDVLAELTLQNYRGYLSIEYENEAEVENPSPSIRKGIEYIKSITYYDGFKELLNWQNGRFTKMGWSHFGPGYFSLDEKEGILTSHGGMGLFWYSKKKFGDFIFALDFKCSEKNTNSGVFLRVPDAPTSNDYIQHSFEVQIYDSGEGIHKTGAIYDAVAPSSNAFKETGEWNHLRITLKGKNYKVELNDQLIVDWDVEPRGKITDFSSEGYIGLQNHDDESPVYFKNIFIKEPGDI